MTIKEVKYICKICGEEYDDYDEANNHEIECMVEEAARRTIKEMNKIFHPENKVED